MKFELTLLFITGFVALNIYYDGKYVNMLKSGKKYYQIALVCFLSLSFYLFIKRHPGKSRELMGHSADFIKYMPIDRNTANFITPVLDFTNKAEFFGNQYISPQEARVMNSGNQFQNNYGNNYGNTSARNNNAPQKYKRSVSETKKKYVAASQHWKCAHCNNELSAWFEVDHKVRLEDGGSNHVDNLRALCRECHGKKTGLENL